VQQQQPKKSKDAASSKPEPKPQQQTAAEHPDPGLAALQAKAAGPTGTGNPAAAAAPSSKAPVGLEKVQHPVLCVDDTRVEAAMRASAIHRLKSRPGRVYAGSTRVDIPDVSVYQLGDQTGHHAKLFVWVSVMRRFASCAHCIHVDR
jgi:hypothetical protein